MIRGHANGILFYMTLDHRPLYVGRLTHTAIGNGAHRSAVPIRILSSLVPSARLA